VMNGNACRRWLAADPPDLDEARDAAMHVVAAGERAGSIIARIRALVRGGLPERHLLDANDVIREAVGFMRSELERHGLAIETDLREGLPPILGDRVQLQQVLVNLFLNAADAMADVTPPPPLTVASRPDGSGSVLVEVADGGKGIDAEQAGRMFEAFYSTKSGGLGMGLTISRSIVEMHGGKIWAAPNGGGLGASLRFVLPAAPPSGSG
jgi:signal transduction histidine kinase